MGLSSTNISMPMGFNSGNFSHTTNKDAEEDFAVNRLLSEKRQS
jgi:hypothetical protein